MFSLSNNCIDMLTQISQARTLYEDQESLLNAHMNAIQV